MKRKIFYIILLILILLGAGTVVLFRHYFTQEKIKSILLPALEKKVQGEVSISSFEFGFVKGLVLKNIKIQRKGQKGISSFQCKEAFLHFRILPLIFGKLAVSEICLVKPQIFWIGEPEGFPLIPSTRVKKKEKREREKRELKEKNLYIENLLIKDGDIIFMNSGGLRFLPPVLELNEVNFSVSNLSAFSTIPLYLSARIKGIDSHPFIIKGWIRPREGNYELGILWETIQIESLNHILNLRNPLFSRGGVDLEFHLKRQEATPLFLEGRVKLKDARLFKDKVPERKGWVQRKKINVKMDYQLFISPEKKVDGEIKNGEFAYQDFEIKAINATFSLQGKVFNLSRIKGKMGKGTIQGKGFIKFLKKEQNFSLNLQCDYLPVESLILLSKKFNKRAITGVLSGRCQLTGSFEEKRLKKDILRGKGEVCVYQGEIGGVKVLEQVSALLGYEELNPFRFSEGRMNFSIEEEKVKTEGWIKSKDIRIDYHGKVLLDSTLNLILQIKCAPLVFNRFKGFIDYLKNEEGMIVIPLKLKGTWSQPALRFYTSEFKKMMRQRFQQFYEGFN